jgi:hypothetical protein
LAWLEAANQVQSDEQAMLRLEFACGMGWATATLIALSSPLFAVMTHVLSLGVLAITLVLAYLVTAPEPEPPRAVDAWSDWPSERPCLVRIINLSRVAARPSAARLLLRELEKTVADEPLANWPRLRELHAVLDHAQSGCAARRVRVGLSSPGDIATLANPDIV